MACTAPLPSNSALCDKISVYFEFRLRRVGVLRDPKLPVESNSPSIRRRKCGRPRDTSLPAISSSSGSSVTSSFLFRHLFLIPSTPDPRPRPVPRRHPRQVFQQQVRRLPPRRPRRHPLRLKGPLAHRQGFRPHPQTHAGIVDPRFTSQNPDPVSRRYRLYHLVALHQTRQHRD